MLSMKMLPLREVTTTPMVTREASSEQVNCVSCFCLARWVDSLSPESFAVTGFIVKGCARVDGFQSAMPDDLVKSYSKRDLRDLVA